MLTGAYVELNDLLALRFSRANARLRRPPDKVVGNRAGAKLSNIKGRGVDLAEVRVYQPGDDVRSMDWRVTARTNTPHTKVFREERERPALIVVDQTQNMFFGSQLRLKSVAAAEVAARVAWQTLAAGDRVGGVVLDNHTLSVHRPYRTNRSVARLLGDMVIANQALNRNTRRELNMEQALWRVRRLARTNHRITIISDFAGDLSIWQDHLHNLARHNQVVAVQVSDPLEAELPPADHYLVTNGQARLAFFSGHRRVRDNYARQFQARQQSLEALCRHDAMQFVPLSTTNEQQDLFG